jgi:hypothetical protein
MTGDATRDDPDFTPPAWGVSRSRHRRSFTELMIRARIAPEFTNPAEREATRIRDLLHRGSSAKVVRDVGSEPRRTNGVPSATPELTSDYPTDGSGQRSGWEP